MENTSESVVTISSSSIQPLQGSPSGDSPKASILQTLKRPSISKDLQKIIAKREKYPPKSEYDIPSLPPLPPLTDSYKKTTFTAKNPDHVSSQENKLQQGEESSPSAAGLSPEFALEPHAQNKHPISSTATEVQQGLSESICQVTSSNVQPTISPVVPPGNSSSVQSVGTTSHSASVANSKPRPYTTFPSGHTYKINSHNNNNGSMQPINAQSFTPVSSLGTSSHAGVPTTFKSTSNMQPAYSSRFPTTYPSGMHPGLSSVQTAHAQMPTPQFSFPYPASYPQGLQQMQGLSAVPMDPRIHHGITNPNNGYMVNSGSVHFPHNYRLSVPMNVNGMVTPRIQLPMSSQPGMPGFQPNPNLNGNASKLSSTTETLKSHPRPMVNKGADKPTTTKKDCADIIVRYLTPYYKSGEVESKSLFKSLAKEMTEKLVQNMGGVCEDKLRNTARALVKMYFDEKRRKSSKVR